MAPKRSIIETRSDQMFPVLTEAEIGRLRRFGDIRSYAPGERLATTGKVAPGMIVILSGEAEVAQHEGLSGQRRIVMHGPGSFSGELATLSGRPALVDVTAKDAVEALVLAPDRLRDSDRGGSGDG